jgi:acetyltransferase
LDPILKPRSVAVIGASRNPRKRGFQALRTLLDSEYRGRVYPVSRNGGEVLGLSTAKSLEDLKDTPDLAFICTPAESVPGLLEMCGRRGVKGAVVSAVGFRESGEEGAALERQMLDVAGRYGIRLVGPNTSGVINTAIGLNLVGVKQVQPGRIALLSQSGNLALDVIKWAAARSQGISVYVGVGNEADIAFHEYLEYLEVDDNTAAILMYVEGFRNGRKFIEVAKRVSETKPIVLLKGGRSERGVVAARSHTGAIAGSYPVLRAALRQGGVSEVRRSDELLLVGEVLAGQPPVPAGAGVVVITDGGGHGTLAADALAELGVEIAQLSSTTRDKLREVLGCAASVDNPIDVAGAADQHPGIFVKVLEIVAADETVGGVLLVGLFGGYAIRFAEELAPEEEQAACAMAKLMAQAGSRKDFPGPLALLGDNGGAPEVSPRWQRSRLGVSRGSRSLHESCTSAGIVLTAEARSTSHAAPASHRATEHRYRTVPPSWRSRPGSWWLNTALQWHLVPSAGLKKR